MTYTGGSRLCGRCLGTAMKKSRKFVEVAAKLWPTAHRRFGEMCTLAVTGQVGGAQMCELNEHIAACESWRKFLESGAQVSMQAQPLLADKHTPEREAHPTRRA